MAEGRHARAVARRWFRLAALVLGASGIAGCSSALVEVRPGLGDLPQRTNAIVVLPPRLGFGQLAEQRRAGRYMGDFLIEATGGRAILAEELEGTDPELIARGLVALGEDPRLTVTFSIMAARGNRTELSDLPGRGSDQTYRHYSDYTVRLDVRSAESSELIGSVETYDSARADAPEHDSRGRPNGLTQATEHAMREALRRFAPRLIPPPGARSIGRLVEVPRRSAPRGGLPAVVSAADQLHRLQVLYPEIAEAQLRRLLESGARLLVLDPGRLGTFGIERGDLVRGVGHDLSSRATLARALARGEIPAISIDRPSGHFLLAPSPGPPAEPAKLATAPSPARQIRP